MRQANAARALPEEMRAAKPSRGNWVKGVLFLVIAGLVLAACRTAPPPPPPPADTVTATADPGAVVDSLSLAPGEWKDYELNVPAGVRESFDVVYLELANAGSGAVLELRSPVYWGVMASSAATSRFVGGAISGVPQPVPQGEAAAPADVTGPAAVSENLACRGPCVIFDATTGSYYARVVNDGAGTLAADVHLYGYDLQDDTEPQNDRRATAPVLEEESSGAIELLGDVDYWLAPADLSVTLAAVPGVNPEVVVTGTAGLVVAGPYRVGETFPVYDGESLRVRAVGNSSAGAPAASTYFLSSEPLPPGTPGRPPKHVEVTASSSGSLPVDTRLYDSGQTVEFLLSVPSNVRSSDVMYVELSRDVGLEVRTGSGASALASSSSSEFFRSGAGQFAVAEEADGAVEPSAVDINVDCRGSCVILEPGASTYRVSVTNFGSGRSISLYAYGLDFMDETEPQNDGPGSAPVLTASDAGAIEIIGDIDFWNLAYGGTVRFDVVSGGIELEAEIVDALGDPVPDSGGPYFDGESLIVFAGEYVRVWAADPQVAASSANSSYYLEYTATNPAQAASRDSGRPR